MGRAKPASKARKAAAEPTYTLEQLLEMGQESVDSFQWEVAEQHANKAMKMDPRSVEALELKASICLETGRADEALPLLLRAVELEPESGYNKYLTLGQLHDGHDSLRFQRKAVTLIEAELSAASEMEDIEFLRHILSSCYCSMAESYLTDLCFDDDAEERCEEFCGLAIRTQPRNPEALQSLASLRLSQERPEEAASVMEQGLSLWYVPREKRMPPQEAAPTDEDAEEGWENADEDEDPGLNDELVPAYEIRINTVRLLLELGKHETALDIAELLLREDDEVVQVWYLCGWASYLLGDKEAAVHYLSRVPELYTALNCDDEELRNHTQELLAELGSSDNSMATD